jgi:hypothetical protein
MAVNFNCEDMQHLRQTQLSGDVESLQKDPSLAVLIYLAKCMLLRNRAGGSDKPGALLGRRRYRPPMRCFIGQPRHLRAYAKRPLVSKSARRLALAWRHYARRNLVEPSNIPRREHYKCLRSLCSLPLDWSGCPADKTRRRFFA